MPCLEKRRRPTLSGPYSNSTAKMSLTRHEVHRATAEIRHLFGKGEVGKVGDRVGNTLAHCRPDEDPALEPAREAGPRCRGPGVWPLLNRPVWSARPAVDSRGAPGTDRSVHVGQRGRVQARVAGHDPGCHQLPVVVQLPRRPVETFGVGPAPAARREGPGVDLGAPHQVGDLTELVGHTFTDPPAGWTVDEDEERGARDFVVAPGLRGHDHGKSRSGLGGHFTGDLHLRTLGDDHQPDVAGKAELVRLTKVPSRSRHRSSTPTTGRRGA